MDPFRDGVDPRLARVLQYVARDLTRQPTLAEVARIAGLERTYFCKYFQWSSGVSFSEWSRSIRVEHAKKSLAASILPITTIALAVGYSDVTTFARNFRKCVGLSPRQYRQQKRRNVINTTTADNSTTNAETTNETQAHNLAP